MKTYGTPSGGPSYIPLIGFGVVALPGRFFLGDSPAAWPFVFLSVPASESDRFAGGRTYGSRWLGHAPPPVEAKISRADHQAFCSVPEGWGGFLPFAPPSGSDARSTFEARARPGRGPAAPVVRLPAPRQPPAQRIGYARLRREHPRDRWPRHEPTAFALLDSSHVAVSPQGAESPAGHRACVLDAQPTDPSPVASVG